VNGLEIVLFSLDLSDPSLSAVDSPALIPPVFDDYPSRRFRLLFRTGQVEGSLTSLGPSAVPEPAAGLLLVVSLGAMTLRNRSKRL
jgi:hypothetical protein